MKALFIVILLFVAIIGGLLIGLAVRVVPVAPVCTEECLPSDDTTLTVPKPETTYVEVPDTTALLYNNWECRPLDSKWTVCPYTILNQR